MVWSPSSLFLQRSFRIYVASPRVWCSGALLHSGMKLYCFVVGPILVCHRSSTGSRSFLYRNAQRSV
ncbi:hypothetical protein HMPREF3185_01479 [Porphyromonas somerae]|uniref:Uncharacterized protein n=1 Tax=Porphyromonas somerae TaxID=322095 RepID=A0A134B5I8_9PORP|nr:hypothetical protein HMPREF3184_01479 [Porphyromonadaceae bacterium KA00676]KXB75176.1 hypothetical protein HMPREF3185_01479 [Porphyromonas somerae]